MNDLNSTYFYEQQNNRALEAHAEAMRPTLLYRPTVKRDGNQWCALLGENIMEGVCGFGDSPDLACRAFDDAWYEKLR